MESHLAVSGVRACGCSNPRRRHDVARAPGFVQGRRGCGRVRNDGRGGKPRSPAPARTAQSAPASAAGGGGVARTHRRARQVSTAHRASAQSAARRSRSDVSVLSPAKSSRPPTPAARSSMSLDNGGVDRQPRACTPPGPPAGVPGMALEESKGSPHFDTSSPAQAPPLPGGGPPRRGLRSLDRNRSPARRLQSCRWRRR